MGKCEVRGIFFEPTGQLVPRQDYPFRDGKEVNEAPAKYQRFTAVEHRAIDRDNALRLLPLLGAN